MAAPPAPQNFQVIDYTKGEKQPQSLKALAIGEAIVGFLVVLFTITGIGIYTTEYEPTTQGSFVIAAPVAAAVIGICCDGFGIYAIFCGGQSGVIGSYFVTCVITCIFDVAALLHFLIGTCSMYFGDLFDGSFETDDSQQSANDDEDEDEIDDDLTAWAMVFMACVFIFVHMILISVSIHFMRANNRGSNAGTVPPVVYMQNPASGQNPGAPSVEIKQFSCDPPAAQYAPVLGYQAPAYQPPLPYQYQQPMLPPAYPYPMAQPATYPPPMPGLVYGL